MLYVYSDGSSHARGGLPGGWGFALTLDDILILDGFGGVAVTSNNRMELTGAIRGLEAVLDWLDEHPDQYGIRIVLCSDSEYCLGIANGRYSPSKNLDLAVKLRNLARALNITTRWVPGHSGIRWNEHCDKLAKSGKDSIKDPSAIS